MFVNYLEEIPIIIKDGEYPSF